MTKDNELRCSDCGRKQARMRFSNTQLANFDSRRRAALRSHRPEASVQLPRCLGCTGGPADSLDCYGCDKNLNRERFSKAQRKNGDRRMCLDCSTEKSDREPHIQDAVEEEGIYEDLQNKAGGLNSAWAGSVRSALPSAAGSSLVHSTSASRADDQVWIRPTPSSRADTASNFDNSDNEDTATQMGISEAGSSRSNGTWAEWNRVDQSRRTRGQVISAGDKFHSQGAVKASAEERAEKRKEREERAKAKEEDDEELSSESGSDDDDDNFEL